MPSDNTALDNAAEDLEGGWYIVKQASNQCEILLEAALEARAKSSEPEGGEPENSDSENRKTDKFEPIKWGPFKTQNQAIAKRIGLIRAGKCQPS